MEYYRRKTPNCAFDLCTQDAPAQHWCKGLHFTGIASTLRASSKTLPGETLDGGPSFGFRRALWVGRANPTARTARTDGASSEWARGRSVVIGTTAHEAWKTSPTPPPLPPPRDHHLLNAELNIDLSVAVCIQVSLPAFSVLLLSCLVCSGLSSRPRSIPALCRVSTTAGESLRLLTGIGHRSENTTVGQHDTAASLRP